MFIFRLLPALLLFSLSAVHTSAGEPPRSIELHFAAGYSDRLALDSTMTVELHDGMLEFRTGSGHVLFASDELTGWDLSSESGRPLLNDVVTSEGSVTSDRPRGGALVQVSGRRIHVLVPESGLRLTLSRADGVMHVSATTDSEGRWHSPELTPGIYILELSGSNYKFLIQ
ncbi:MAG: hypothetical protein K2L96_00405 [Muribaculaceae bacterium]|nr:hypothetical protein [Muribaculaceae bacterium]